MKSLKGKVAVVTGASRGAGRGIALALGDAGATVYVAGRTVKGGPKPLDQAPGTIDETAAELTERGGLGIAVRCDCTVEAEVAGLFERVRAEHGRIDLLANAVWGWADSIQTVDQMQALWSRPFWEQPVDLWNHMMMAGPFAYLLASRHAARMMAAAGGGLIVGMTDGVVADSPDSDAYGGQLLWDLSHRSINRLLLGMAHDAKPRKIAVVTLMPGFMRTERVLMHLKTEKLKKMFRLDLSESVEYVGRAVAALAADPEVMRKTGQIHFVADLAREYSFTDVDGKFVPRFAPHG
jgi:NAD(P)-dependent dehydrogenase (short-subunit alcohol dehydrogenase family)